MKIVDLFARIGLQADEGKAQSFDRTLGSVKLSMIAVATAAVGVTRSIRSITDEAFNAAAGFKQFESETGASIEGLQRWQSVAQATNNSAQAVLASVKAIAENQAAIRLGQGNISGYQLLGIDPRQDPFEILEQLREKTQGLSQSMKQNVLSQIGVSAELIQVLQLTNEEFERMAKSAFVLSPESIKSLDDARASGQELRMGFRWLKQMIAAELSPSIQDLNRQILEWIRNNKDGIVRTLKDVFVWVRQFVEMVGRGVRMLDQIITNTIGWEKALFALVGVIALMNASLLLSPLGVFIAGIVLLLAVLEDLYVYGEGGKSLFGYIMENFPEFANILDPIIGAFNSLKEAIALIFAGDKEGFRNLIDEWGAFGDIILGIIWMLEKVKALQEWFHGDPEAEQTAARVAPIVGGGVLPLYDFNAPKPGDRSEMGILQKVQATLNDWRDDVAEFGLIGSFLQPGGGDGVTTNTMSVEINGATDPIAVGNEVDDKMRRFFNQASAQRTRDE